LKREAHASLFVFVFCCFFVASRSKNGGFGRVALLYFLFFALQMLPLSKGGSSTLQQNCLSKELQMNGLRRNGV
jgi:hypothetical protein